MKLNHSQTPHRTINIGDKVVYSTNGIGKVGVVTRTDSRTVGKTVTEFLVIKLMNSTVTVYVAKTSPDIQLRKIGNKTHVETAFHILSNSETVTNPVYPRWDRCVKEARAILGYSAPVFGQAECLMYLQKIRNKRAFSLDELNLFHEVKDSFVSEVSEITSKSRTDIESELNSYID